MTIYINGTGGLQGARSFTELVRAVVQHMAAERVAGMNPVLMPLSRTTAPGGTVTLPSPTYLRQNRGAEKYCGNVETVAAGYLVRLAYLLQETNRLLKPMHLVTTQVVHLSTLPELANYDDFSMIAPLHDELLPGVDIEYAEAIFRNLNDSFAAVTGAVNRLATAVGSDTVGLEGYGESVSLPHIGVLRREDFPAGNRTTWVAQESVASLLPFYDVAINALATIYNRAVTPSLDLPAVAV